MFNIGGKAIPHTPLPEGNSFPQQYEKLVACRFLLNEHFSALLTKNILLEVLHEQAP